MDQKLVWMLGSLGLLVGLLWNFVQETSDRLSTFPSLKSSSVSPGVEIHSQDNLGNTRIESFNEAKRIMRKLYVAHPFDFYCGCRYADNIIDFASCGFQPYGDLKRAKRVEWEHIVPAADFGRAFSAWRQGDPRCKDHSGKPFRGRSCARLVSTAFNRMESDLYNLVPAIGEVNGMRRDYPMGLLPGEPQIFGRCMTKIARGIIEPRVEIRGFIARTYKYMHDSYRGRGIISRKNEKLFEAWDKQYAPTQDEVQRARQIAKVQGNINRFVEGTVNLAQREELQKRSGSRKP